MATTWDYYGQHEPHYGILTTPAHRQATLDASHEAAWWASGEQWIAGLWQMVQAHVCPTFSPGTALDFGCGIGRLVRPLADRCEHVIGVDVSVAMLERARQALTAYGNVELATTAYAATELTQTFDLVHSYLVLQHIPPREGWPWLRWLAERVAIGGVLAVQLVVGDQRPVWRKAASLTLRLVPGLRQARNVGQGRPWREPVIPMYAYPLGQVQTLLAACGYPALWVQEYPHKPLQAVTVVGQRGG